ncbi:hypothetical protein Anas_08054 [Armadillidium nasatum]|uniref:Uncharacterized protein n=1 Tax=Armadillidium nasatum TaxID=96803 RepID=A0A5N5T6G6_9CRUS|nr:hypothetical protein Anas_08054 [Armadillidium nasatum]
MTIIFVSLVAAVSAAPQLFFVVPPQFLESQSKQELNNLIASFVPVQNDQSVAASTIHESHGSELVPEVAVEAQESEAPVAPVVASEVEESLPSAAAQEEPVQDEAVPQPETEVTTDASLAVDQAQEIRAEETTEPQPSVVDVVEPEVVEPEVVEPEVVEPEVVQPEVVQPETIEPEVVTDAAPQQEEIILPETSLSVVDTPTEVLTNEVTAQEVSKPEETIKSDPSSGKSIQSAVNVIPSTTLITHFGYNPNTIIRSQPNTITHQGTVVDPRALVPAQFRHFIYENDAPEVVAAKVAFFRVQAALTPRKL